MKTACSLFLALTAFLLMTFCTAAPLPAEDSWSDIWEQRIEIPAPDFVLTDLQGNKVGLRDFRGMTVLLNFTTTWCPTCRSIVPYLKETHEKYRDRGLVILNINIQESQKKVSAFASRHEISWPVLLDPDARAAKAYQVIGVPDFILVNREGMIICRQCRSLDLLLETIF